MNHQVILVNKNDHHGMKIVEKQKKIALARIEN